MIRLVCLLLVLGAVSAVGGLATFAGDVFTPVPKECGIYEVKGQLKSKKELVLYPHSNGERLYSMSFEGPEALSMLLMASDFSKQKVKPFVQVTAAVRAIPLKGGLAITAIGLGTTDPLHPMKQLGFSLLRKAPCKE